MSERKEWTITESDKGQRLDHFLNRECPELTRSFLKKCVVGGHILLNDKPVQKAGQKLKLGFHVVFDQPEPEPLDVIAQDIPLDIIYEDSDLIVINKPVGLVVHPAPGHPNGTLVNALLHHCDDLSGIGGVERPGIVHRLDKDTSGLLVVAKNDKTHVSLSKQLETRDMKRHYYAISEFGFPDETGTIEAPIARHPADRKKMAVVSGGRFARTHWTVKTPFKGYTLLEVALDTGRTHQIRVHLKHIQRPIVGDAVYGSARRKHNFKVERPLLHAWKLGFIHPTRNERCSFEAEIPADFQRVLDILSHK